MFARSSQRSGGFLMLWFHSPVGTCQTKLQPEVHVSGPHEGRLLCQVQPQWRVARQLMWALCKFSHQRAINKPKYRKSDWMFFYFFCSQLLINSSKSGELMMASLRKPFLDINLWVEQILNSSCCCFVFVLRAGSVAIGKRWFSY